MAIRASTGPTITTEERVRRQRAADDAAQNSALEGLTAPTDYKADAEDYVAGLITADELVERTRTRYGCG